jgi:hypothetical protein
MKIIQICANTVIKYNVSYVQIIFWTCSVIQALREYLNGNRPVFTCNENVISVQCRNIQYVYCDAELLYILQMSIYLCAL